MADVDSKITIKLLIDARSHKVIFGEAGKNFIDFMFSLLTLPLGFVIKLLSPQTMNGSIGKLYQSVENLNETYLVVNRDKSTLLQPKVSTLDVASPLLMGDERNAKFQLAPAVGTPSISLFSSSSLAFGTPSTSFFSSSSSAFCSSSLAFGTRSTSLFRSSSAAFGSSSAAFGIRSTPLLSSSSAAFGSTSSIVSFNSSPAFFLSPVNSINTFRSGATNESSVRGFVKDVTTYMITDDLEVTPMSAISSITLINRFNMKDAQLEEKVVVVGMKEGLALLKASLESSTVLTDVFCSSAKKTKPPSHSMMAEV